jgi:hypothetical protein
MSDNVKKFPADRIVRIPVNLPEGLDGPVPWEGSVGTTPEQKAHNDRVLQKIFGAKMQPGTPETDADPRNPNVR